MCVRERDTHTHTHTHTLTHTIITFSTIFKRTVKDGDLEVDPVKRKRDARSCLHENDITIHHSHRSFCHHI